MTTSNDCPGFDDVVALGRAMRALARELLADAALADDVVQDAWVTAIERPPAATESLRAWLLRVVRNRAVDLARSTARRAVRERRAASPERDPSPGVADRFAVQADVLAAVRALGEPYRETVYLRYWEGLGPARIGARLGVPTKTVKTRLTRALGMLRRSLDDRRGRGAWAAALVPLAEGGTALAGWVEGVLAMEAKKIAVCVGVLALAGLWTFWPGRADGQSAGNSSETAAVIARDTTGLPATTAANERHPLSQPASAPAHAEAFGALRVLTVWHDGTPAPRITLLCCAEGDPAQERNTVRISTDESGVALVPRLVPGPVVLESDRGGKLATEVAAGAEREVRFMLPQGVDVAGVVIDRNRAPVAGAGIWLTTDKERWLGGHVVATSAADGTFRVSAVDRRQSLGALAAGFAPSGLVDLELADASATPVHVELKLVRKGAVVVGRVTDESGAPVSDGLVAIGRSGVAFMTTNHTRRAEAWTPIVCATDFHGAFACSTVVPGRVPITVRADGYALWFAFAACREGEETRVEVVLRRPATVEGTVLDDAGAPVGGARVLVVDGEFSDWMFEVVGSESAFGRPTAVSDALGHYQLPLVAPGELHLLAHKGRRSTRDPYQGRAETNLQLLPGETRRWDPRVSRGLVIRGRLETVGGGRPTSFSPIHAMPEREGSRVETTSAENDCRFEFTNCDDIPYTIMAGDLAGRSEPTLTPGVRPGGEEVVITLPRKEPIAAGRVRGRVIDAGRRLGAAPLALSVGLQGEKLPVSAEVQGDRFSASRVAPGRYRVIVSSGSHPVHAGEWFELAMGEERDLGDILSEPGGGIVVRPVWPDGCEAQDPSAMLKGPAGWQALAWDGRVFRAEGVSAGVHALTIRADGLFAPKRDIEVVAGQTREVEVAVFAGVVVPMELRAPVRADWKLIEIRVLDKSGQAVWNKSMPNRIGTGWPIRTGATLGRGAYTLEATADNGMSFRQAFELRDLRADLETIVLTLR